MGSKHILFPRSFAGFSAGFGRTPFTTQEFPNIKFWKLGLPLETWSRKRLLRMFHGRFWNYVLVRFVWQVEVDSFPSAWQAPESRNERGRWNSRIGAEFEQYLQDLEMLVCDTSTVFGTWYCFKSSCIALHRKCDSSYD